MKKYQVVKIKSKDKLGYVEIPSKASRYSLGIIYTLNNVKTIDGDTIMVADDDLEEINNDRTEKFIKKVNELYD